MRGIPILLFPALLSPQLSAQPVSRVVLTEPLFQVSQPQPRGSEPSYLENGDRMVLGGVLLGTVGLAAGALIGAGEGWTGLFIGSAIGMGLGMGSGVHLGNFQRGYWLVDVLVASGTAMAGLLIFDSVDGLLISIPPLALLATILAEDGAARFR